MRRLRTVELVGEFCRIPLPGGMFAICDVSDYALVSQHNWFAQRGTHTVYVATKTRNRDGSYTTVYLHRLIMGIQGVPGLEVDHIVRNGRNNCRRNMRVCSHSENHMNVRYQSNNLSGFPGVSWHSQSCKWRARIKLNQKEVSRSFSDFAEAVKFRNIMVAQLFGEEVNG